MAVNQNNEHLGRDSEDAHIELNELTESIQDVLYNEPNEPEKETEMKKVEVKPVKKVRVEGVKTEQSPVESAEKTEATEVAQETPEVVEVVNEEPATVESAGPTVEEMSAMRQKANVAKAHLEANFPCNSLSEAVELLRYADDMMQVYCTKDEYQLVDRVIEGCFDAFGRGLREFHMAEFNNAYFIWNIARSRLGLGMVTMEQFNQYGQGVEEPFATTTEETGLFTLSNGIKAAGAVAIGTGVGYLAYLGLKHFGILGDSE